MDIISREGVVSALSGGEASIQVERPASCSGCDAAERCGAKRENMCIKAQNDSLHPLQVGQKVRLSISRKKTLEALLIAFLLPTALMLLALFAAQAVTHDTLTAAAAALMVMALYFVLLGMFRTRLKHRYRITVSQI